MREKRKKIVFALYVRTQRWTNRGSREHIGIIVEIAVRQFTLNRSEHIFSINGFFLFYIYIYKFSSSPLEIDNSVHIFQSPPTCTG